MNGKLPLFLIGLCAAIAAGAYMIWQSCPAYDFTAMIGADLLMLLLSLAAWALLRRSVAERPQTFIRGIYGATLLRLFVCLTGILTYALMNRTHLHKPTLFVMFGIYILYTSIETVIFSRTARKIS